MNGGLTGSAQQSEKRTSLTREQAMANFKVLVGQYGLQWTAAAPALAYDQLAACNAVLTSQDRREALGLPVN